MDPLDFMFILEEDLNDEPNPLAAAVHCFKSLSRPITDLLHTSSTVALFSCGLALIGGEGLVCSVQRAQRSARIYLISSLVYCVVDAALSSLSTKLREDFAVLKAGAAGCCAGLFRSHFLGFRHSILSGCMQLGLAGIVDYGFNSSLFSRLTKRVSASMSLATFGVSVDDFMKSIIITSTMGSLVGHALILKSKVATSPMNVKCAEEFSAIGHGLLASAAILLLSIHQEKNGVVAGVVAGGALGCWTSLLLPRSFDGPNDVLGTYLRAGLLFGAAKAIYTNACFFPRMHLIDSGSTHSDPDASVPLEYSKEVSFPTLDFDGPHLDLFGPSSVGNSLPLPSSGLYALHLESFDTSSDGGVSKEFINYPQNLSQRRTNTPFPSLRLSKNSYKLANLFTRFDPWY